MSIQTDIEAQIAALKTAITTAIASPAPNWSVGQVKFNQTEYLEMLFTQLNELYAQLRKIPSETIQSISNNVDSLGHSGIEYVGDDF